MASVASLAHKTACTSRAISGGIKESFKNSEPPTNTKPVTSNRKLKKRESDRRCQRDLRQKTKSRIAYLESLVGNLKDADASGQVASLLQTISHLREERDSLARKIRNVESILLPPTSAECESTAMDGSSEYQPSQLQLVPARLPSANEPVAVLSGRIPTKSYDFFTTNSDAELLSKKEVTSNEHFDTTPSRRDSLSNMPIPQPDLTVPPPNQSTIVSQHSGNHMCECSFAMLSKKQELNVWYMGNTTLSAWMRCPTLIPSASEDDFYQDDTPVRAVVEGWDAVEKRGDLHPIWRMIRRVDEEVFAPFAEPIARLGTIYNMSLLLNAHINPTMEQYAKVPHFYLTRTSDDRCPYAASFIAWPGVRKAFARNEHRYCSNHFWRIFANSWRAEWPYGFRDSYLLNSETGLYEISPYLIKTFQDVRKLGVSKTLFEHYPELHDAVGAVDEIPPSIVETGRNLTYCRGLYSIEMSKRVQPESGSFNTEKTTNKKDAQDTFEKLVAYSFNNTCFESVDPGNGYAFPPALFYVSTRDFL